MTAAPEWSMETWMTARLARVEVALDTWVTDAQVPTLGWGAPNGLVQAMRYAVLDGGKRLRPLLTLAAFEALAPATEAWAEGAAMRAACAVELIHAYSLVHDDMPCMDNDVLRRGKPTVHVKFGEAGALLAGDALQALAFELLTPDDGSMPLDLQGRLCAVLSRAAGSTGMAGGQAIDLASVGRTLDEPALRHMHQLKTGALLHGSVMLGAVCGKASEPVMRALSDYGHAIGLAFQVVDDVLDVTADSAALGKTAGKDADNDKPTYVSVLGLEASQRLAASLLAKAQDALRVGELANPAPLAGLARLVVQRSH